ncbi:hypothetical protein FHY55_06170 [Oceanicola sp. D3]|uniref:hypothetical protein n=1 Tax=Oceanicola sp. D3 TaxID=2587163 RepID=UPI001122F655|nr:hypothetical protein [Oceanicola sp. D3]QDC08851.1 hypothetical protein FHY55_06170 [Oceanicola sp. D3]
MRHSVCLGRAALALAIATAATSMALPAHAACPVGADMDKGIRFEVANGDVETARRADDAGQVISSYGADGYVSVVRLAHGVYPLEIASLNGGVPAGTPETFAYATSPLPTPAPGLEVSLEVTVTGEATKRERHDYSFGAVVTWTLGKCAYEMIPVTARHFSEAGKEMSREVAHYFPALGHSYLASYADEESEDVYTYVNVEAVR